MLTIVARKQNKWTIKARVTSKGDVRSHLPSACHAFFRSKLFLFTFGCFVNFKCLQVRTYNNAKGPGKVMGFEVVDKDGGEIKVTMFNQE